MSILSKDMIKNEILPYLPVAKRGKKCSEAVLIGLIQVILYRLKTGCQWRELPVNRYICGAYTYKSVFYHFNRWSKLGFWQSLWLELLSKHQDLLNLCSIQLDGSQSRSYGAREEVAYQARKASKTSNMLCITDQNGIILSFSEVKAGKHHDTYQIKTVLKNMFEKMQMLGIDLKGLILNADAGFDCKEVREICQIYEIEINIKLNPRKRSISEREEYFDPQFYQKRYVIERTFAWLDAYKALLIRYEKTARNWLSFNILAFIAITIKKSK